MEGRLLGNYSRIGLEELKKTGIMRENREYGRWSTIWKES